MPKSSKRHKANYTQVDREKRYDVAEAIGLLKEVSQAKFDETVEVAHDVCEVKNLYGLFARFVDQTETGISECLASDAQRAPLDHRDVPSLQTGVERAFSSFSAQFWPRNQPQKRLY